MKSTRRLYGLVWVGENESAYGFAKDVHSMKKIVSKWKNNSNMIHGSHFS